MRFAYTYESRWSWPAGFVLLLWLVGFELIPTLHVAFHDALGEHDHGVRHQHDGHAERQGHRHADRRAEHEEHDRDPETPLEHGQGSLAHFDIAVNVPASGIPVVQEALMAWSDPRPRAHAERPADLRLQTVRARAPPAHPA